MAIIKASALVSQIETYSLNPSTNTIKFDATKQITSAQLLFLIKIGSEPIFEYNSLTNNWNISADYYDSEGWILNLNDLIINIPGNISGQAYLAAYTPNIAPVISIKSSQISSSSCSSYCTNAGNCQNGSCKCINYYGGYDCKIYFITIPLGSTTLITIPPFSWNFYRINLSNKLQITGNYLSGGKYQLFITPEITNNEIPTMIDSQSIFFNENNIQFTQIFDNDGYNVRIGMYCYDSNTCNGSFTIQEINPASILWIIIFVVIVGTLIITGIPLTLIYCRRNSRRRSKVSTAKITKEQMEIMFPKKYVDDGRDLMCSICLEEINSEKYCRQMICSHFFHEECIDEWASGNIFCPVCKQNIILDYHTERAKKMSEKELLPTEQQ